MAKCSCIYKQQVLENVERMYEFHLQSFNKTLTVNLLEAKVSELQKNKEVFEKEVVKLNEKLEQLSKQMDKAKQAMDSVPKNRVERYNQNVTVYNNLVHEFNRNQKEKLLRESKIVTLTSELVIYEAKLSGLKQIEKV